MFTQCKKVAATLSIVALLSVSAGTALSQEHSHAHDSGKSAHLTLNDGRKWDSDDNLRQGMGRIRDALAAELPAMHSGKVSAEQYRAVARKINEQITFMMKNCKLDQKADEMLHLVLADIINGTDAMLIHDGSEAHKGVEKIAHALDNYGAYFDHPDWHGVGPIH